MLYSQGLLQPYVTWSCLSLNLCFALSPLPHSALTTLVLYFRNIQVPSHLKVSAFACSSVWNVFPPSLHMVSSLTKETFSDFWCEVAPAQVIPSIIYQHSFSSQCLSVTGWISSLTCKCTCPQTCSTRCEQGLHFFSLLHPQCLEESWHIAHIKWISWFRDLNDWSREPTTVLSVQWEYIEGLVSGNEGAESSSSIVVRWTVGIWHGFMCWVIQEGRDIEFWAWMSC